MTQRKNPNNQKVIELLGKLQDVPERDPRAAARGRARFMAEVKSFEKAVSPSLFRRLNHRIATLPVFRFQMERNTMKTTILSILIAFAILLGGGAVTAYAAQDSLPNDALYPVKLFLEDAQYGLTSDPVEQIELLTEFANTRADEIFTLADEGEEIPEEVTTDLQKELQTMLILAAGLDEANLVSVLEQIRLNLQDRDSWDDPELGQALTGVPEGVEPAVVLARFVLTNQHRIAEDGMEEPLQFRQNFGYRQGQENPEETAEVTEPVETPITTPEVEVTEEPEQPVERPGSCEDPDGCRPEERGNPDAGQSGEVNGQNGVDNGQNGNNGSSTSSYYIYIGGHLYLYSNGYYTYVGNGQNGRNGGGNGGGN